MIDHIGAEPGSTLEKLIACRDNHLGFDEALSIVDTATLRGRGGDYKMSASGSRNHFGTTVVGLPNFGSIIEVPPDYAQTHDRALKLWAMRKAVTPDIATVLEVGAGDGSLIVSLARGKCPSPTKFIGTDISDECVQTIRLLSEIGGVNVESLPLDMTAPDLGIIDPQKPLVVIANGALSLFDAVTITNFLAAICEVNLKTLCLFDIFSAPLPQLFPGIKPMPTIAETGGYGNGTPILQALSAVSDHLKITRAIPLMSGPRSHNVYSYFEVTPVR